MDISLEPPYVIIKPGVSEEEFYRLADEDSDSEYLDGRIVMHSPASDRHEDIFAFLISLIRVFLGERKTGVVRGSRYPMRLDERWSPEPDLLVVLEENCPRMKKTRLEGPADLVIEIASESDPGLALREKLPRYREAGIPEIWIVDPFKQEIVVDVKQGAEYRRRAVSNGRLESRVFAGFWIEVSRLWEEELPPTLACVREILS